MSKRRAFLYTHAVWLLPVGLFLVWYFYATRAREVVGFNVINGRGSFVSLDKFSYDMDNNFYARIKGLNCYGVIKSKTMRLRAKADGITVKEAVSHGKASKQKLHELLVNCSDNIYFKPDFFQKSSAYRYSKSGTLYACGINVKNYMIAVGGCKAY